MNISMCKYVDSQTSIFPTHELRSNWSEEIQFQLQLNSCHIYSQIEYVTSYHVEKSTSQLISGMLARIVG